MMDKHHVEDLIEYRLDKAKETIEDAKLLANAERWNPCVNRKFCELYKRLY